MVYVYDGSFDGAMTAIFLAFERKDREASIVSERHLDNLQLFDEIKVKSDSEKSARVQRGLDRLAAGTAGQMYLAWLSEQRGVEDLMLAVCRLGFARRCNPFSLMQEGAVVRLAGIARRVGWEQHRMLQFVRFVKLGDNLYGADIAPEYNVLPLIGNHFHQRFGDMHFFIRDVGRRRAIFSTPRGWQIAEIDPDGPPLPRDGEYEGLWRAFFDAVAIEGRINPGLQQKFVPKKYRRFLTEFQTEEKGLARPSDGRG